MKKKSTNMFELPPRCPALADKITGIFGWRHTYQVHQRQKGIPHGNQYHLYKSYSLNLPRKVGGPSPAAAAGGSAGGGSLAAGRGSSSSSTCDRLYAHHQQQPAGNGSCCVTEPGTPNCEINPDSWVVVHHLQSQAGILDPEDHISDVADDREEIIASYEDAGVGPDPGVQQGGGDGASGSSVGTGSPDIFQVGGPKVGVLGVGVGTGEPPPNEAAIVVGEGGGAIGADSNDGRSCVTDPVMVSSASVGTSIGPNGGSSCIEVSANEPALIGIGLQVRRGSEPSLHQIGVTDQCSPLYNVNPNGHHQETSKRWSAAPVCRSDSDPPPERLLSPQHQNGNVGSSPYHHHHLMSPEWNVPEEDLQQQQQPHDSLLPQPFNRSGRLSMQFLGAEATSGYRWMDAAEKAATAHHSQASPSAYQPYLQYLQQQQQQLHHSIHHSGDRGGVVSAPEDCAGRGVISNGSFSSKSLPRESTRKEPLGQAKTSIYDSLREKDSEMLLVVNETGGPLGLTAIPDKDRGGLLVQSVEPGSRAERGRLRRGDRILEINNIMLVGLSESSVQEHLKKSLASTELRLRVVRGGGAGVATAATESRGSNVKSSDGSRADHNPQFVGRLVTGGSGSRYRRDNRVGQMIEAEEKPTSAKVATVSPTRKMPGAPSTASSLQVANTRKLGKRIEITLTKGDHGLGFSVTTRDNPAGGHCPIYIKNILPKGSAVEDGRLKPGDRLLEVEGIPMTGKSQTEVVSILRGTPHGATLKIIVSRQQELADMKEREIGFSVECEPKNSLPKPPPPVLPKSSLKQSSSSNNLASHYHLDVGGGGGGVGDEGRGGVSNSRSLQKLSSMSSSSSSPKPSSMQKKPLASILKSASTNQVADQLLLDLNGAPCTSLTNGTGTLGSSGGFLSGTAWKNREILTLHIPVHDTEKAGLGVSVKGKTGSGNSSSSGGSGSSTSRTDGDLGIFVKSVLHGGAASRDGRLKMNDQLLSVNGVSLLGQSNAEAMETLRRAMLQSGGNYPGKIILTVARRIGRPVSTGELLETMEPNSSNAVTNSDQQQSCANAVNAGTTVIYLSPDKQQQQSSALHRPPQENGELKLQQSKRYSNPVLDRLTGGNACGNSSTALQHTTSLPLMMGVVGGNDAIVSGGHYSHSSHSSSSSNVNNNHHQPQQQNNPHNQRPSALRTFGVGPGAAARGTTAVPKPSAHGLRNESYYMATGEHWSTTSSVTSLNGSNAVLIEEDPEPISPTFHLARTAESCGVIGGGVDAARGGALACRNTSTPTGADTTYASQLSLETNTPPSDAFSRDAIGRRSMSEKHHAAMDARETGTYQRNKKLREERERDSKLMSTTGSSGSMESVSHQLARMDNMRHTGGIVGGRGGTTKPVTTLAAHLLRDEAQDQLGDLGPSLGMKKSSSLESLQTMVQEIQMADEPRGPNALRTPRGRGREEILRAVVEQPPETQAKKHWLLEEGPSNVASTELPDGGFVSRHSPFQSSLNDGKGLKLRAKKSGGLLRGIGHMFRFGKHRKDDIAPAATTWTTICSEPVADYIGSTAVPSQHHAWLNESNGSGSNGNLKYGTGNSTSSSKGSGGEAGATAGIGSTNNPASRYIVFDPNSVERSASSGVAYGHHQPPHYQPPPPPPAAGGGAATGGGTSIHHTDVFNHRYSHYVNYDELQQQISNRILSSTSTIYSSLRSSVSSSMSSTDIDGDATNQQRKQGRKRPNTPHVYDIFSCNGDHPFQSQLDPSFTSLSTTRYLNSALSVEAIPKPCREEAHRLLYDASSVEISGHHGRFKLPRHPKGELQFILRQWELLQRLKEWRDYDEEQLPSISLSSYEKSKMQSTCSNNSSEDADISQTDDEHVSVDRNKSTTIPGLERHPTYTLMMKKRDGFYNNPVSCDYNDRRLTLSNGQQHLTLNSEAAPACLPLPSGQKRSQIYQDRSRGRSESRRQHHYHSQRSTRNTPPVGDIGLLATSQQKQQQQQQPHQHHHAALMNQSHPQQPQQQQKYKSTRPASSYYDTASGGYETISSIGPPLTGTSHRKGSTNASGSNNHATLTVSSSNSISSKSNGSALQEDSNGNVSAVADWQLHHHPGTSGGTTGPTGGITTGSMRNTRGPFVTQVKIQNQMSYQ